MSATLEGRLASMPVRLARLPGAIPLLLASVACFAAGGYLRSRELSTGTGGLPLSVLFLGMGAIVLVGALVALLAADRPASADDLLPTETEVEATPDAPAEPAPEPEPLGSPVPTPAPRDPPTPRPTVPSSAPTLPPSGTDTGFAFGPRSSGSPRSDGVRPPSPSRTSGLPPSTRADGTIECATCGRILPGREAWRRCRTCSRPLCASCLTDSIRSHGTGYCREDAPVTA